MSDETKLNAAVIGLGVGEQHAATYLKNPNCKLVGICDFNVEKLKHVSSKIDAPVIATTDPNLILNDPSIDLISIASWDNFHAEQIVLGLQNKKHLFIEKPLCVSEREATQIEAELEKHPDLRIGTNLILRLSPRFLDLKRRIAAGEIGDFISVEGDYNYGRLNKILHGWRNEIDWYSGVLGGGIHMIDLMLWITRLKVLEVAAFGGNIATRDNFKNFDLVTAILKFEGGHVGKMSVNLGCVYPHFHKFCLYGTKATFENNLESAYLYENFDKNEREVEVKFERKIIDLPHPGTGKGAFLDKFIQSLVEGTPAPIPTDEIFDSLRVCFAIERAAHSGKIEKVKYDSF